VHEGDAYSCVETGMLSVASTQHWVTTLRHDDTAPHDTSYLLLHRTTRNACYRQHLTSPVLWICVVDLCCGFVLWVCVAPFLSPQANRSEDSVLLRAPPVQRTTDPPSTATLPSTLCILPLHSHLLPPPTPSPPRYPWLISLHSPLSSLLPHPLLPGTPGSSSIVASTAVLVAALVPRRMRTARVASEVAR
jgi:hypothetical protein